MKQLIMLITAFMTSPVFAVPDKVADITISPPAMDFIGPRDSVLPGKIIGNTWSAKASQPRVFYCGQLWNNCKRGTMIADKSLINSGLTYTIDGANYTVFETGVAGIGFVIGLKDAQASTWIPLTENQVIQTFPAGGTSTINVTDLGWDAKVTFIKTNGILKSGIYNIPAITAAQLEADGSAPAYVYISPTSLNVTTSGCTVMDSNVSVNMGAIDIHTFPAVGSTSQPVNFNVNLSCDPQVSLYATLTDQTDASNSGTVVSLTKDSTASGLGVQFLFNGIGPLGLGPDNSNNNNINQFFVQQNTTASSVTLPFQARYLRTGDIKPGSANALASITFSYQ